MDMSRVGMWGSFRDHRGGEGKFPVPRHPEIPSNGASVSPRVPVGE